MNLFDRIPAPVLVLFAIVAIQLGAAIAINLFPLLGPQGTVALRIIFSAALLCLVAGNRVRSFTQLFASHWRILCAFGLCIATMNIFFYLSIARIPLGAAVAFEFIGPLGVAVVTSKRISHIGWVALAALGIVLLSPVGGTGLDIAGVIFALLAGAGWATFIILAGRVSTRISGNDGLAIGMTIAALVMIPFAVPLVDDLAANPLILIAAFGVALLSTTIPFTLEFEALKRLTTPTYGVLVSVEPAAATLVGALLLGERLGIQGMIAVGCIVIAAIGITVSDARNAK